MTVIDQAWDAIKAKKPTILIVGLGKVQCNRIHDALRDRLTLEEIPFTMRPQYFYLSEQNTTIWIMEVERIDEQKEGLHAVEFWEKDAMAVYSRDIV
jgi:hypothetical protein